MPLSDEQRSMVQLLLGGQSYDDIASLLGVSSDEVRSRARGALTEIGGADPDAQVALSDFLLGQADPIGRADAVRHLQADADANALASRLVSQLRLLVPGADLPEIPAAKGGRRAAPPPPTAPPPPASPSQPPGPADTPPTGAPQAPGAPAKESLSSRLSGALSGSGDDPKRRSQVLAALVALGLLIVVGVLAIAGVFGGGDGGDGDEQASTTATDADLTIVELAPLSGDAGASGQAVFAQAEDQPLLQINLNGLEPAGKGNNYIIWLYNSPEFAFPLARDQVGQNDSLTGAAPIPQEILPLLSQFGCVDVSLASDDETVKAIDGAVEGQALPSHVGQSVLRGEVPTQPGEQAPSGADAQCEGTPPPAGGAGGGAGGAGGDGGTGGGAGGAGADGGAGGGATP